MRLGSSAVASDTGRRRRRNEDAYVCQPPLFAIADGMGGAQAGEVASQLAASALREGAAGGSGRERLEALIQEANRRVFQRANEDAAASGMGTTVTAALVETGVVWFGHVGDSRAYLIRDGRVQQLTEDHTLVQELVRGGKLSLEEAGTHPQRSVITRAVGTDVDVDVDTFPIEPVSGDVFLICSDGLTDMVGDDVILDVVERHRGDLTRAAQALVGAANKAGGDDNITVVAFEMTGEATEAADAEELEETQRLPAATADDDEADTLDELDAVPAVDTMVISTDEIARWHNGERDGAAPKTRRRSLAGRFVRAVLVIAILAAAALAIFWWLSQ